MCLPPATGGRAAMCVMVILPRRPSPEVREAAEVFVRVTAEYNFIVVVCLLGLAIAVILGAFLILG